MQELQCIYSMPLALFFGALLAASKTWTLLSVINKQEKAGRISQSLSWLGNPFHKRVRTQPCGIFCIRNMYLAKYSF